MRGLLGIGALLLLAWGLSEDRFRVAWRVVVTGVLLQFALALLFLKFPPATAVFLVLNQAVEALQKATEAGTSPATLRELPRAARTRVRSRPASAPSASSRSTFESLASAAEL